MITKISIKNYKSLEDVTLTLGPLTVLVGANASGKSNILDALSMLKELLVGNPPVDSVLARRGDYQAVVWGSEIGRDISIELNWEPESRVKQRVHFNYSITFGPDDGRCVIKGESIGLDGKEVLGRSSPGTYSFPGGSASIDERISSLQQARYHVPQSVQILNLIGTWVFYDFDLHQMRPPHSIRNEYRLNETGNNLSTVLHALFSIESPLFRDIFDSVKSSVPVVEKLVSPIVGDNKTQVALKEKDVPEPVAAWGLSDGTLFSLALATALLTPEVPSLLTLEAPDTTLHPYVMEHVAEMLKSASRKTQVIATTHSPYLLDFVPAESIVIVEKVNGKTICKPVKGRKGVKYAIEKLGAGDAWYSGHLGGVP